VTDRKQSVAFTRFVDRDPRGRSRRSDAPQQFWLQLAVASGTIQWLENVAFPLCIPAFCALTA
jgi:hypothetical protein